MEVVLVENRERRTEEREAEIEEVVLVEKSLEKDPFSLHCSAHLVQADRLHIAVCQQLYFKRINGQRYGPSFAEKAKKEKTDREEVEAS